MSAFAVVSTTQPQGTNNNTIATTAFAKLAAIPAWVNKTAAYTASSGDFLIVNTVSAPVTITLPANPIIGMVVNFSDGAATWNTNNLTIFNNGSNIAGSSSSLVADTSGSTFYLLYVGGTIGWKAFNNGSSIPGVQGVPGNTTIPANAVAGNIPTFSSTSGSMNDSGTALTSLATNAALTTTNNNVTTITSTVNTQASQIAAILAEQNIGSTDIRYLFLKTSALSGTQLGMIDGIVDPFNNIADISTSSSLSYLFNSTNGTIGLATSVGYQFLTVSTGSQAIVDSTYSSSYPASQAFDGSYSTVWAPSTSGTGISGVSYLGQDFGSGNSYAVSQVLYCSSPTVTANISSVILQYSDNASTWTSVNTFAVATTALTITTITIPANIGTHRAWRLLANGNLASGYNWNVSECNFQISIPVGTNVDNASQAIASGAYSTSYPISNAFDGSVSDSWNSAETSVNQSGVSWIGQDFGVGNAYALSQIVYYGYPTNTVACVPTVLLQYSDSTTPSSGSWTTVGTYTLNQTWAAISVLSIPASSGSHRAWRLLANGNVATSGNSWGVAELQMLVSGTLATVSNAAQAIQSSDGSTAANAFDQNFTTNWGGTNLGSAAIGTTYIGQDFGAGNAYTIGNLIYTNSTNAGNCITSASLQYSDNLTSWTTAVTYTGLSIVASATMSLAVPSSAGSHRAWRFICQSSPQNTGYGWTLMELQFQTLLNTKQVSAPSYAISSGDSSGAPSQAAFDNNSISFWQSSQTSSTPITANAYLGQDFGSGVTTSINAFSITNFSSANNSIASVILQYSDNLSSWTNVSTYSLNTIAYATGTFTIPTTAGSHRAWRILANANTPTTSAYNWDIYELVFYSAAPVVTGITLQSTTLSSAVASPSTARVFVQLDSTSVTPTLNTDIFAYFSRDGGTTFTQGTLALAETLQDGTVLYDTGSFSLSGQPTGNSTMTYRIVTANGKAIVLTGAGMQVRP